MPRAKKMASIQILVSKDKVSVVISCNYAVGLVSQRQISAIFTCDENIIKKFKLRRKSFFLTSLSRGRSADKLIFLSAKVPEIELAIISAVEVEFGSGYDVSVLIKDKVPRKEPPYKSNKKRGSYSDDDDDLTLPDDDDNVIDLEIPDELLDFEQDVRYFNPPQPPTPKYEVVNVFYATNRAYLDLFDEIYSSDRQPQNSMEFGHCTVSIPYNHVLGKVERPGSWRRIFSEENPEKHVTILGYERIIDENYFFGSVGKSLTDVSKDDALIFIHGYNVDFNEAIRRTAQMKYDILFEGPAITFSWPSKGKSKCYVSDIDACNWSVPHLKDLIKKISIIIPLGKLHIIAHSMGNVILTQAIKELKAEGADLKKINQIVLAAPDIEARTFTDVIVPGIIGVGKQITLYASSKDRALRGSRHLRGKEPRVGEGGKKMVTVLGIDSVDASTVRTFDFFKHSYFAEAQALINDLYMVINLLLPPNNRPLKAVNKPPKLLYWKFMKERKINPLNFIN